MKMKFKPKPTKKIKINKTKIQRKKIPARIRMSVIIVLGVLALASLYSAAAITPEGAKTIDQSISVCNYRHSGSFYYIAHLKDNTVYNTTTLLPGQAILFKKITNYLNTSLTYKFSCDLPTNITGSYKLSAEIQTDIWNKQYTIIPTTKFNTDNFKINFNINYSHYEGIVSTINSEIGVTAADPTLVFKCEITITAQTSEGLIYDKFAPTLTIPLTGNILEIGDDLSQSALGSLTETIQVNLPEKDVSEERDGSLLTAAIFALPILPVAVFTKNDYTKPSKTEKEVKKIMKKYGEWIVEIEKMPNTSANAEIISIKSLKDLVKTSEELGKPIMYYSSEADKTHEFYVLDDPIYYEYVISDNSSKIKRSFKCTGCDTEVKQEGEPGEDIIVECPNCGKKGILSI